MSPEEGTGVFITLGSVLCSCERFWRCLWEKGTIHGLSGVVTEIHGHHVECGDM